MGVIHILGGPRNVEHAANTIIADQCTALATAHDVLLSVKRFRVMLPEWLGDEIDSAIALIEGKKK